MKNPVALAALLVILAACTSGGKLSASSTSSPTPVAAAPTSTVTPCVVDASDNAPCPGTPEPVMHKPLPPPGAISDSDVAKHLPAGLSAHDRKIVERVMLAQPTTERQDVRWVFCKGRIFVFSLKDAYYSGLPTAVKVLNDDPFSREHGGDFINIHNCIDFPMPGA